MSLVSIITPTYNAERTIASCIESVIAQTYLDWEMLITDDCSQDSTVKIVEQYAASDARIRLIRLEKNGGAGAARNRSITEAQGRYIAFLDADDRWMPNKLQRQVEFMQQHQVKVCYSSYVTARPMDVSDEVFGVVPCPKRVTYRDILRDDRMGCLTLIYDARSLGKVLMPLMRRRQDWAMKILLLQKAGVAYGVPDTLAVYRVASGSLSGGRKSSLVRYNVAVYRETLGYSNLRAWLAFAFLFMPHYLYKRLVLKMINSY